MAAIGRCVPGDQAGLFQHLEVFRNGLQADGEWLGQLVDRGLALGEPSQDGSPRGIGEGRKRAVELIYRHQNPSGVLIQPNG